MAFEIKQGATRPTYAVQLRENVGQIDEAPVDISTATGVTSVRFLARLEGATPNAPAAINAVAIRLFPTIGVGSPEFAVKGGWVEYDFNTTDTDVAGSYEVQINVVRTADDVEKFPNKGYFSMIIYVAIDGSAPV